MGSMPFGAKPPCAVRLATLGAAPGHRPRTKRPASIKKTVIAATLIEANQNSNSPNDLTEMRFVRVSSSITPKLMSHGGSLGNQKRLSPAPATVPLATTLPQSRQQLRTV